MAYFKALLLIWAAFASAALAQNDTEPQGEASSPTTSSNSSSSSSSSTSFSITPTPLNPTVDFNSTSSGSPKPFSECSGCTRSISYDLLSYPEDEIEFTTITATVYTIVTENEDGTSVISYETSFADNQTLPSEVSSTVTTPLTWTTKGLTLSYPTTYAFYDEFVAGVLFTNTTATVDPTPEPEIDVGGQSPQITPKPKQVFGAPEGCVAVIDTLELPATVNYMRLLFDTDDITSEEREREVLDYLASFETVSEQLDGQDIRNCLQLEESESAAAPGDIIKKTTVAYLTEASGGIKTRLPATGGGNRNGNGNGKDGNDLRGGSNGNDKGDGGGGGSGGSKDGGGSNGGGSGGGSNGGGDDGNSGGGNGGGSGDGNGNGNGGGNYNSGGDGSRPDGSGSGPGPNSSGSGSSSGPDDASSQGSGNGGGSSSSRGGDGNAGSSEPFTVDIGGDTYAVSPTDNSGSNDGNFGSSGADGGDGDGDGDDGGSGSSNGSSGGNQDGGSQNIDSSDDSNGIVIDSQTILPGETATINGVPVVFPDSPDSNSLIIDGTRTEPITFATGSASEQDSDSDSPLITSPPALPPIGDNDGDDDADEGSNTATVVDGTTQFVFGPGTTLTPGGMVTIDGTRVSLAEDGETAFIGSSTIDLSPSVTASDDDDDDDDDDNDDDDDDDNDDDDDGDDDENFAVGQKNMLVRTYWLVVMMVTTGWIGGLALL